MDAPAISKEGVRTGSSFYLTMAILSAVIIFVGFSPSFYLRSVIQAPVPPLSLLAIVHGLVFTLWIGLFIAQVSLIAANNVALHRQLGMMGALLFGAMLSLGYTTALTAARLGHAPPGAPPLNFMALPLIGLSGTFVLVALALWTRKRSDWHRRLMLAALFTMTPPGTGRIAATLGLGNEATSIALGVSELLLAAAIIYDYRSEQRVHPAYSIGIAVIVAVHLSVVWAFSSPAWLTFARAIT